MCNEKKKYVMISQPMAGLSSEVIRLNRQEIVKKLEDRGYEVLDSIFEFNCDSVKFKPLYYLSKSIALIAAEADAVYFMDGWENARGCKLEYECCKQYGVPIILG